MKRGLLAALLLAASLGWGGTAIADPDPPLEPALERVRPQARRATSADEVGEDPDADAPATEADPGPPTPVEPLPIHPPREGMVAPYPFDNLFRGFDGGDCTHQGLDIGGVGPDYGVGTPVVAMVKAEVVALGTPEGNPRKYGHADQRRGKERRRGHEIPRRIEVPGYGIVYPFTTDMGSAATGVLIVTRAIGTEIDGYTVRYMHLAAIKPDLSVGDVVEPGQEIGLMGGTGFVETPPHLHLDITDLNDVRVDPAPLLGLQEVRPSSCKPLKTRVLKKERKAYKKRAKKRRRQGAPDTSAKQKNQRRSRKETKGEAKQRRSRKETKGEAKQRRSRKETKGEAKQRRSRKETKGEAKHRRSRKETKGEAKQRRSRKETKGEAKQRRSRKETKGEAKQRRSRKKTKADTKRRRSRKAEPPT